MLSSMTGYGRQETLLEGTTLSCEMRSVNHRFLELSLRMPEELRPFEPAIRDQINKRLKRGKVEVSLRMKFGQQESASVVLNEAMAQQVIDAARRINSLAESASTSTAPIDPVSVLNYPGVVGVHEPGREALGKAVKGIVARTLDDLTDSRRREGDKTTTMLTERLDKIHTIVSEVKKLRPAVVEHQQEKLKSKLAELEASGDPGRLEQELVYVAQRLDVDEELDRLDAHVSEMRAVLERKEPVGRRLDFLLQEFNREANTLGSKSSDVDTTGNSVELKVIIEQMREQIQNIE